MPDTFTANLNLTKPEVGLSTDTWGTKLNAGLDSLDAIFAAAGTGTAVGLNVGAGRTLDARAGTARFADANLFLHDSADLTKIAKLELGSLTTGTTRTYTFPDANGTFLLTSRQVATGAGLTGGGDLSTDRTLSIPTDGIVTAMVAADAITWPKIQNVSTNQRALVRKTAGAGDIEEGTASEILDWLSSTRGAILYRGASGWVALSPSTVGFVLTDGGPGADPSWGAAVNTNNTGGVGSYQLMANVSGSGIANAATIAGSSLRVATFSTGNLIQNTGNVPAGTWRNVSGAGVSASEFGLFIRTA